VYIYVYNTLRGVCVVCQNADYMTAQVFDLTDKLEQSEAHLGRSGFVMGMDAAETSEDRLTKATKDRSTRTYSCHFCADRFHQRNQLLPSNVNCLYEVK